MKVFTQQTGSADVLILCRNEYETDNERELDQCDLQYEIALLQFLANVNSRSLYALARPFVCLSSVCLSVTFVRPTQAVQIFSSISTH